MDLLLPPILVLLIFGWEGLLLMAIIAAVLGVLLWLAMGGGYYPPVRRIPKTSLDIKAARIEQITVDAEREMQDIFLDTYGQMIREARKARIEQIVKERRLS